MNMNAVINMVIRLVMRRLIGKGVNAGIDMASRGVERRGAGKPGEAEAERDQVQGGRDTARRAGQASRLTRRLGRF